MKAICVGCSRPGYRVVQHRSRAAFALPAWQALALALVCTSAVPLWALGPAVSRLTPEPATNNAALTALTLGFTQALDPARAASTSAYEVLHLGADRAAGGSDDSAIAVTPFYAEGADLVRLDCAAALAEGRYRITVRSDTTNGLRNLAAEYLDQNQDGTPESYVGYLDVDLTPPAVADVAAGAVLALDGDYDTVKLPAAAANGLTDMTLECWFRTSNRAGQALLSAAAAGLPDYFYIWMDNAYVYVRHSNSQSYIHGFGMTLPDFCDGAWHHLAVGFSDAANTAALYLDGVHQGTMSIAVAALAIAEDSFLIGQEQDAVGGAFDPNQAFAGEMAELRLWSACRTPTQIADWQWRRAHGNEADLRACWPLDDGDATVRELVSGRHGLCRDLQSAALPLWAAPPLPVEGRTLLVTFSDTVGMDTASVTATANYRLTRSGGDALFGDGDDVDETALLSEVIFAADSNRAVVHCAGVLTEDWYRLVVAGSTTVRDLAGNPLLGGVDYVSDPIPVTVGAATLTAELDPASDSGASNNDQITNNNTPTLNATVNKHGTVTVDTDGDGTADFSRVVAAAGTHGLSLDTAIPDGNWKWTVTFTPWVGEAASTDLAIIIDTQGPSVLPSPASTESPCSQRPMVFSEPVQASSFSPDDIEIRAATGAVLGTATGLSATQQGLSYLGASGHWYLPVYRPEGITWAEAEAAARGLGGYLACLANDTENRFVHGLIRPRQFWKYSADERAAGPWIGLRRNAAPNQPQGIWSWVSGEPYSYTHWGSSQPSNSGGVESAAHYWDDGLYWNDLQPTLRLYGFVIEFDDQPSAATAWTVAFKALPGGADYTLLSGPEILDVAGNALNQDGDGTNGEAAEDCGVDTFAVAALRPGLYGVSASPSGSPTTPFTRITVCFSLPPDTATVATTTAALTVPGGATLPAIGVSSLDDLRWEFDFGASASGTVYDLTVGPSITSGGTLMDQDGDGLCGEPVDDVFRARLQRAALSVAPANSALDGTYLVLSGGIHTIDGNHGFSGLSLLDGAILTHSACTADTAFGLDLMVTGKVLIDASSAIDVSAKGYLAGRTHGNTTVGAASGRSGGGHGGLGRANGGVSNAVYGDAMDPDEPGSGGGDGGPGGGLVRITCGVLQMEGRIVANGGGSGVGGLAAGSGGGVSLRAERAGGAGVIEANGGSGEWGDYGSSGGAGAGGRIALHCAALADAALPGRCFALPGAEGTGPGACGTVYVEADGQAGTLSVDSHGTSVAEWVPLLPDDTGVLRPGNLVIRGAGVTVAPWDGAPIAAGNLAVLDGANLTHLPCTDAAVYSLEISLDGTLHVDAASTLDASGRGYLPERTSGNRVQDPPQLSVGGSHGGLGRAGTTGGTTPEPYDDATNPRLPGGGGAGAAGGGVIRVQAQDIVLDGALRADGANGGGSASAGAGGSVCLHTTTLTGSGCVSADGGAGNMGDYGYTGGSGGGGRVALYYADLGGFDVSSQATAHSRPSPAGAGSVGTVYVRPAAATAQLRIDSHDSAAGVWTPLLPGADGSVRLGDLVVQGAGVVAAPWEGAPMVAADVSVLGGANLTHPLPSATKTYALLLTATGTLHVDATSSIDVSNRGYPNQQTLDTRAAGAARDRSGGSYGGDGFGNRPNALYGLAENPRYPGSGGAAAATSGGAGGGLVRLHAAEAKIEGAIRANGGNGSYYWAMPGGSGGGILLNVGDWSGAGVVEAQGGNGNWGDYGSSGGSGGGGRIALYVSGNQGAETPALSAAGGSGGSGVGKAGTVATRTVPAFFWADDRPLVLGAQAGVAWELLGAPADTRVSLYLTPANGAEALLATNLPPVGSHSWDASAVAAGRGTLRAAYTDGSRALGGEASRQVLVCHNADLRGGTLSADETWEAGRLHLVAADVTVPPGVTLTLAADALLKVAEGRRFRVLPGGAVAAAGGAAHPAVVTSLRDDSRHGDDNLDGTLTLPRPGDWGGFICDPGASLPAEAELVALYGVKEHAEALTGAATWDATNLHYIRDTVTVPATATLTIAAGAVVVFDRMRLLSLPSNARLEVPGAAGLRTIFTSLYDPEWNPSLDRGAHRGIAPSAGDWQGIYVDYGSRASIDRATIAYGGGMPSGYNRSGMLRIFGAGSSLILRNSRLLHAQHDGVYLGWADEATEFRLENSVVAYCDTGLAMWDAAYGAGTTVTLNSTFHANRVGISAGWGDAARPRSFRNLIVADSAEYGIACSGYTVLQYNDVWGSGTANYLDTADQTGTHGNISANPRFRSAALGNWHLAPNSPCIDAADGTYAPAADADGYSRTDHARTADRGVPMPDAAIVPDLGAFEFSDSAPSDLDLVVDWLTGPATMTAGDTVRLVWQVTNVGTGRAEGGRSDRLLLVASATTRGLGQITVAEVPMEQSLGPGQSALCQADVRVPVGTPGPWTWRVTVNSQGDILEGANQANNSRSAAAASALAIPTVIYGCGDEIVGALSRTGDAAGYGMLVPNAEDALVRVNAGAADARLRLYAGVGFVPTVFDYDWVSPSNAADPRLALPAAANDQTVYLLIVAEDLPSGPTSFTVAADELAFVLDACDLRRGGNAGSTTVRLTGAGFANAMTVSLRAAARDTISARQVSVLNSGEAFAVFGLDGAALGVYDVVAEIGGAESVINRAFTVTEGLGWTFVCRITAPPLVRPERPFPVVIEFENTGDSDCPPIMMTVSNNGGFPIWRSRRGTATSLCLAAAAPSGPTPGYLRTGDRFSVAAWSASSNLLCQYSISWRSAFCTEPADWGAVEAALCPCESPHWDEVWPALQAGLGDTDGDFIAAAAAVVAEARTYAVDIIENGGIFQWLLQRQAYRLGTAPVSGVVRRQGTQDPVGNTRLALLPQGSTTAVTGRTWYDGSFAFWDLPAGSYKVLVEGAYGGGNLALQVPAGGVLRDTILEVPAGGTLSGRVTDALDGMPVPDADIQVLDPLSGVGAQSVTGADGRYRLSGLPQTTLVVRVLPVDHAPTAAAVQGAAAGATTTRDVAVQPGAVISGRVSTPGGAGVAGATVLASPADGTAGRSATSAASGSYEVRGLAAGTYRLVALASGHGPATTAGTAVAAGGTARADLVLSAAGVLHGSVTDSASGNPVSGAEIAVRPAVADDPAVTDAMGDFSISGLPAGDITVAISAPGYLPLTDVVVLGRREPLPFRLDTPWLVEGRLLDGGSPAAGLGVLLQHVSGASASTAAAADGTYRFDGLQGGDWALIVSGTAGEILVRETLTLAPTSKVVWREYDLQRGRVIGRVLSAERGPLAGARVALARAGELLADTLTDSTGAFEFRTVTGGTYDVSVARRGFGFARRSGVAVAAGGIADLGDWSPSGAGLQVTVTDGTTPLTGAAAELVWLSGLGQESVRASGDAAGVLSFGGLAEGEYRLNTTAPGRAYLNQSLTLSGTNLAIAATLAPEGVVVGRVATADGSPLPFAMVWAVDLVDQVRMLTFSDLDGQYRLEGLPAHAMELWVTDSTNVATMLSVTPVPATTTTADVVLPSTGARLSGRTLDDRGYAMAGVQVELQTTTGAILRSTITGMDGAYALGPLPSGVFVLYYCSAGIPAVVVPVVVSGDEALADVAISGSARAAGRPAAAKWSIWDWLHGQKPPSRYINDTAAWRYTHEVIWQAYLASGKNCPTAAAAYRQATFSSRSLNTRYEAWLLADAAMRGMTSAEMSTLLAEIGILTGKISLLVANLTGSMEAMQGPAFLTSISPNAPADLVTAYNDMGFAIDFVIDSLTRLVATLQDGNVQASEVAFEQMLSSAQFLVGMMELFAKVMVHSGVAGSASTWLAGGPVGKFMGVVMTLRDLYGYWKGLKEKERNIIDTIKQNEYTQEMYHDMVQLHIVNLATLAEAVSCDGEPPPPPPPPQPTPPPGGWPDGGSGVGAAVGRVISRDPNAKESLGVGAAHWVAGDRAITYLIHFENEHDASAPAQTVTITDVLDADLDTDSFEILQVSFNGTTVDIPPGSRNFLGTGSVASDPYPVRIRASLDPATRTATWVLQSYDPATGELPAEALAGFLPPNDDTGRGEGFVSFRIAPREGLTTGTGIRNVARIVFDENDPIMTNQVDPHDPEQGTDAAKEALATVDAEAPLASYLSARKSGDGSQVELHLTLDDGAGSGPGFYEIHRAENAAPLSPWETTTQSVALFAGAWGTTYRFLARGYDAVGQAETLKTTADAAVQVPDWAMPFTVSSGPASYGLWAALSTSASAGFDAGLDEGEPPEGGRAPRPLHFEGSGANPVLAYDVRHDASAVSWRLRLQAPEGGVRLAWDRGRLPAGRFMWLVRLSAGPVERGVPESFADLSLADSTLLSEPGVYLLTLSSERTTVLRLQQGWNLASTPVDQSAGSPGTLCHEGSGIRAPVWTYPNHGEGWSRYAPKLSLEAGDGFWAYAPEALSILLTGRPLIALERTLQPGWNLVGVGTETAFLPAVGMDSRAWCWHAATRAYRPLNPGDSLMPGQAYWIRLNEGATTPWPPAR